MYTAQHQEGSGHESHGPFFLSRYPFMAKIFSLYLGIWKSYFSLFEW